MNSSSSVIIAANSYLFAHILKSHVTACGAEVVAITNDALELSALVESEQPTMVISEMFLSPFTNFEVLAYFCQLAKRTKILVISPYHNVAFVQAMLGAGVQGYLLTMPKKEELQTALYAIPSGGIILDTRLQHCFFHTLLAL
jgi:DNA-binding NarL/FixJ family response regulator